MKPIIISGSSRKDGETNKAATQLSELLNCNVIDLCDYHIKHFDYEYQNQNDDFLRLITDLISKYDTFIFATPVYWYSMSGLMKVFFDRLSDLLTINKELGRKLRGKNMSVITSSVGNNLEDNFWIPFKATAAYLSINYLGNQHTISGKNNIKALTELSNCLKN